MDAWTLSWLQNADIAPQIKVRDAELGTGSETRILRLQSPPVGSWRAPRRVGRSCRGCWSPGWAWPGCSAWTLAPTARPRSWLALMYLANIQPRLRWYQLAVLMASRRPAAALSRRKTAAWRHSPHHLLPRHPRRCCRQRRCLPARLPPAGHPPLTPLAGCWGGRRPAGRHLAAWMWSTGCPAPRCRCETAAHTFDPIRHHAVALHVAVTLHFADILATIVHSCSFRSSDQPSRPPQSPCSAAVYHHKTTAACNKTHRAVFHAGRQGAVVQQRNPQPRAQLLRRIFVQLRADLHVHRRVPLLLQLAKSGACQPTRRPSHALERLASDGAQVHQQA